MTGAVRNVRLSFERVGAIGQVDRSRRCESAPDDRFQCRNRAPARRSALGRYDKPAAPWALKDLCQLCRMCRSVLLV